MGLCRGRNGRRGIGGIHRCGYPLTGTELLMGGKEEPERGAPWPVDQEPYSSGKEDALEKVEETMDDGFRNATPY